MVEPAKPNAINNASKAHLSLKAEKSIGEEPESLLRPDDLPITGSRGINIETSLRIGNLSAWNHPLTTLKTSKKKINNFLSKKYTILCTNKDAAIVTSSTTIKGK